jgi:RHS repeat-associated protein
VSVPDGENKRWSYYRVVQKTHSDKDKGEVEPRVTRYEYSSGQPYQLYSNDPSSVSRRWYFKEHRIIDPLEQATRKVYYMGMLEYMFYPANIYVYNEYDMESRLLKLKRTVQSTSMHDVEYEYDGYGQMTKMIDHGYQAEKNNKDQRVTIMRYDNSKHEGEHAANVYNLVAEQYVEEPSKNTTNKYGHMKREYDDRGRMTKEQKYYTDTNYVTDEYAYDNYGNITTHTDPNGTQTSYTYQYNAYPQTQTTVADNKTFKTEAKYLQYTGSLFSQKDENGYETTYAYDKLNRKTKETHPDSTYIQTDYRDSERKTEVTDRKNRKTVYNYNPFGELKTITDPLNYTTTYQTDKLGRLETIRLADNREYRYGYDVLNRATRITYPDGSYAYKIYVDGSYPDPHLTTNPDGSTAILVYDENGHGMAYWKDAYGNLSKVVKGDDNSDLIYEYELNSLKSITSPPRYDPDDGLHTKPAKRYVTRFENDLLGRRTKKIQPDSTYELFEYDNNGNLTKHTNYENKITNYNYDGLNRITNEVYDDTQYNVYYEYDNGQNALTRLTKIQDKSGSTEYKYNNLGLITEEKKTLDGQTYVTAYTYDNTGLLQNISYPQVQGQNTDVSYTYDELYRIQAIKLNGSTLITNTYDNTGRLTSKSYGNGIKETYIYDAKDRLTEHEAKKSDNTQIFLYKYTYDPAGNMVQRDITDDNALRRRDSYEYDYINQLTRMNVPGDRDIKYTYDELHNRTNMQHGFGHITYNYDEEGMNYLQSYEEDSGLAVQYAYDKQGNPTEKLYKDLRPEQSGRETAREIYTWNDRDELTQITGRVTESYTYDYRGLRHIKDSDGNVSKYVYLQNNQPGVVERSRNDAAEQYTDVFIYEGTKRVARIRVDASTPLSVRTEVFINNYQGSPIVVLSDTGDIQYQKYLDPWGNMEMEIGRPSSDIEFQYTDKEYDEKTNMYQFWHRYIDPYLGRFISRDKVHLEDKPTSYFQLNPYIYSANNPIRYFDPNGMFTAQETTIIRNQMLSYASKYKQVSGLDYLADKDPEYLDCTGALGKALYDLNENGEMKNELGANWGTIMSASKGGSAVQRLYDTAQAGKYKMSIVDPANVQAGDIIIGKNMGHAEIVKGVDRSSGTLKVQLTGMSSGKDKVIDRDFWLDPEKISPSGENDPTAWWGDKYGGAEYIRVESNATVLEGLL